MDAQKKRIVICSDGTWNTPENPTNVVKVVRSIKPISAEGIHQVVFYDQGVGTYNAVDKFIGGAFGKGVEQNVLDAYRFIAHNFKHGDEIYCFGFSRGAYTARALGGMLQTIGLIDKGGLKHLPEAYKYYRSPPEERTSLKYNDNFNPDIKMMAVWDTVGALGAPTPILGKLTRPLVGYYDTHLSPQIKNAYQALAIDEKRAPFKPALWTGSINPDQSVEQVWFSGVHSDVGGGYVESGLSDIALKWMIQKSIHCGLEFDEGYLNNEALIRPNATGVLHDSYHFGYRLMEKMGMDSGVRQLRGEPDNPPINVSIHASVLERVEQVPSYQPENLVDSLPVTRTNENRQFIRISEDQLEGEIISVNDTVTCQILDYSPLGGARIQCKESIETVGEITISSPKFAKKTATLAWKKDDTYGLKFAA